MKNQLIVVIKKSGTAKSEEHSLKPKAAFALFQEVKAQQKRRWPEVGFAGYVDKKGERGDVHVWRDETSIAVMTPQRVFVQEDGEKLRVFSTKTKQKKPASKKKTKKKKK